MRILLLAVALAPCVLLAPTPTSSEPIFILNCRLINVDDKLFRQHCKAQDRECGGDSCWRAKRKARTAKSRIPRAAHLLDTSLSAAENAAETSSVEESTDISADKTTERTTDPSDNLAGGDSPGTNIGEGGLSDGSDATGAAGEAATTGSDVQGAAMGPEDSASGGAGGS